MKKCYVVDVFFSEPTTNTWSFFVRQFLQVTNSGVFWRFRQETLVEFSYFSFSPRLPPVLSNDGAYVQDDVSLGRIHLLLVIF